MSRGQPSQDPVTTNSYDDNEIVNTCANPHIEQVLNARLSRRQALGLYPGQHGSSAQFFNPRPEARPAGAIVVGLGEVALALASGSAGALAFTTGLSATLIGVMVAVALLPPLVAFGLLMGSGHESLAWGAMLLFIANFISVNLSGVATFLAQGIRPQKRADAKRAKRASILAMALWILMLALLVYIILMYRAGVPV